MTDGGGGEVKVQVVGAPRCSHISQGEGDSDTPPLIVSSTHLPGPRVITPCARPRLCPPRGRIPHPTDRFPPFAEHVVEPPEISWPIRYNIPSV